MGFSTSRCDEFVEVLASKAPVPGGGGASALVAAVGTALGNMVGSLTVGKKKYADVQEDIKALNEKAEALRADFVALIDADAEAFAPLSKAYGIPKDDPERAEVMETALLKAVQPPMEIMRKCVKALDVISEYATKGSALAISDAGCAAALARAAADAAENPLFAALAATSFAYEGWVIATTINAEIKNAKRNLPLALVFGVGAIMLIYLFYYVGIAGAVPNSVMMENGEQGARIAFSTIFGPVAGTGLFVFVVLSCLGTCNGLMMACTRGFYSIAARGRGPKAELLAQVDRYTNMPNNAASAGLVMCAFWCCYFYFGALLNELGPFRFDSSELPVITLYAMYIPIYLLFMKKARDERPFRRFVLPALALIGAAFMILAAIFSYKMDCVCYLLVYAVAMALGWLLDRKNHKQ